MSGFKRRLDTSSGPIAHRGRRWKRWNWCSGTGWWSTGPDGSHPAGRSSWCCTVKRDAVRFAEAATQQHTAASSGAFIFKT